MRAFIIVAGVKIMAFIKQDLVGNFTKNLVTFVMVLIATITMAITKVVGQIMVY